MKEYCGESILTKFYEGRIAHDEGKREEAIKYYKQCFDYNPDYTIAMHNLG